MPLLVLVMLAPAAAAGVLALDRRQQGSRLALPALFILAVLAAFVTAAAFTADPPFTLLWDAAHWGPVIVAFVLVAEMLLGLVLASRVYASAGEPAALAMLRSTTLGRRALRAAEEEQRDQSAQHVHDRVLPRLRAGILGLETGDTVRSEQELRQLAEELRAEALDDQLVILHDAGLVAAVRDAVARTAEPPGVMHASDGRGRPPAEVETATLRIAQEAIRNVVAHASADGFEVRLDVDRERVSLEVEDDGVGMDGAPLDDPAAHLGRRAMQARAREVGGSLSITPGEDGGTIVHFHWPG